MKKLIEYLITDIQVLKEQREKDQSAIFNQKLAMWLLYSFTLIMVVMWWLR